MPTGYTYLITKNPHMSVQEFILLCARAFGPCAHQRDDDITILPTIEPAMSRTSTYHRKELDQLNIASYTDPTVDDFNEYVAVEKSNLEKRLAECRELKQIYTTFLNKITNWSPATEYWPLKSFIIEQLESSIKWDTNETHIQDELSRLLNLTYQQYVQNTRDKHNRDREYHESELQKSLKNEEKVDNWVLSLYKELNIEYPTRND